MGRSLHSGELRERERERGGAKGEEGVVPARVPALFHGG